MRGITKLSIAAAVIGIGSLLISYIGGPSQAATIDRTRDCDNFAVIRCGTMTADELRTEYDSRNTSSANGSTVKQSDIPAIFTALGVSRADLNGSFVKGVVYKDGTVRVNDKVVARNAQTAIRNVSGTNISGSSTAKIVPTSRMGTAQEALVKLNSKGQFLFAVMTPCGNPVKATNTVPEPPKPKPNPTAQCDVLNQPVITNRTNVALSARASVANGATISGYVFTITNAAGQQVATQTVNTTSTTASTNMTVSTAGTYTAKVTVKTSLGDKTAANCEKKFTIKEEEKPGVKITKKVDGVDHKAVETNVEFTYQIRVTNTGNTDLKNVAVTDEAERGVTFISASHGTVSDRSWNYTIPELKKGAHADFTIKAKVPEYKAGTIKNTVCVDAPTVPGKPDDCDDATVEVPEPKKKIVCVLKGKEYPVTIDEKDFDANLHSENPEDCKEEPVTPPTTTTPPELPKTGAASDILNLLGVSALATSIAAYVASRRNNLV